MKLHIVTVGEPKLAYAKAGWQEYTDRLRHYHQLRITHVADKWAYDASHLLETASDAYLVALVIGGTQLTSPELAQFLDKRALEAREVCFVIGGPEGLPPPVIERANYQLGLSKLTFPHDLAMVVLAEALYRASTIAAGQPYHK
ncbi:MAG TPA: 23S rRNA (pseudouridine(1915)-N(3))-methyltransferase RlmH [Candidatus Saccharimonadales bacterium]|nr:23S rRNA (pseudouridine(1915)-N(3))-methyltransferase RlmH [Candidatus Saccharimonadales bacterium]